MSGSSVRVRGERKAELDVQRFAKALVALSAALKTNETSTPVPSAPTIETETKQQTVASPEAEAA